jgi:hypothetical protein
MDALKESMAKQGRSKVAGAVRKHMGKAEGKAAPKRRPIQRTSSRPGTGSRPRSAKTEHHKSRGQ